MNLGKRVSSSPAHSSYCSPSVRDSFGAALISSGVADMRIALVFPGQASQEVGMGRTFFDAFTESREIFERADKALGFSITDLCFNGPDEKLKLTEITQPSILTVSVAIWQALASKLVEAGHEIVCAAG